VLDIGGDGTVERFAEKPANEAGYINAGFFVLEPQIFDYLGGDSTVWEEEPLRRLAAEGQLHAYKHHGFWRPMDSLRDKRELESLWLGQPPWKLW
jgi:glucose-1-phosphate cytidylyltransferase